MIENIVSILSIVALIVIGYYISQRGTKKTHFVYTVYFISVFILGITLHLIGILHNGKEKLPLAVVHSVIASFRMFLVNIDTGAITELAGKNNIYLVLVSICYFAAITGTVFAVINAFFNDILNNIGIFFRKRLKKTIVLYDSTDAKIFLNSLSKKDIRKTIVILPKTFVGDVKATEEIKKKLLYKNFKVIYARINYKTFQKAGAFNAKNETVFVSMSDSDEINLTAAKIYTDFFVKKLDIDVKEFNTKRSGYKLSVSQLSELNKLKLSINIMYNYLERTEHFDFVEKAFGRIKFFNIYEIRARKFFLENPITKIIPYEWINTDKARLNKKKQENDRGYDDFLHTKNAYKISNIFVGFGSTNGYLLNKSICNGQMLGCDYRAVVFDKDTNKGKLQFFNNASGIDRDRLNLEDKAKYFPHPDENYNIDFIDANVLSIEFYDKIIEEVKANDFAVFYIALGDDRLSVETALEIRQKLCEYKDSESNISLFNSGRVKIFIKENKKSILSDKDIINYNFDNFEHIVCFGADKEVLNMDYIVNEKLDKTAIAIANSYANISDMSPQEQSSFKILNDWNLTSNFKRESNRYAAMSIQMKLNLLGFDLDFDRNIVDFKSRKAVSKKDYFEKYDSNIFCPYNPQYNTGKDAYETTEISDNNKDIKFIPDTPRNNLARLEHQRWNAFHLINGWTKLPKKDVEDTSNKRTKGRQNELTKQHACITTFEGLMQLRDIQAKKNIAKDPSLSLEEAKKRADTITYDYHLMDKLFNYIKTTE